MYSCRDFYKQWHLSLDLLDCKDLTVDLVVRQAWRPIVLLLFGFKVPVQTKQIYCINANCKASFNIQLMHRTIIKDLLTSRTYCITVLYVCTGIQENNCFVKMFQYFSEQYVKQLWSEVQTIILLCPKL